MKTLLLALTLVAFTSPAFASDKDAENTGSTKVTNSDNPITGTHTHKVKRHSKMKDGKASGEMNSTETTKTYKDGTQKKTVDVDGEAAGK